MAKNPVVWFEVMGQDTDKLLSFYGEMFSWPLQPAPNASMEYHVLQRPEKGIGGGIGKMPEGAQGFSTFYVHVEDVQASLDRAQRLGGKVLMPLMTLPDGMKIGMFSDPEGHPVGVCNFEESSK
ncbi:MAG: VOC family protein [Myxococcales bacterium]|nr:VOC family protein [Myxococcales bacterium]MCB9644939.1 VOC family protein [Myxococcales bacterium]